MENWRLSKIEEELGKFHLDSYANSPREPAEADEEVKIVIRPAYKKTSRSSKQPDEAVHTAAAVRRIKEKYDAPVVVSVTKVDCAVTKEHSTPVEIRSSANHHQPSWEQGPNVLLCARNTGENLAERLTSSASQVQTIPVFPLREHRSEEMSRQNDAYAAGIRPTSTAAKSLYSSFRGQTFLNNSNEHSNNNLSPIDSKACAMPPDATDSGYSLPSMNFPVLHPFVESSRASTIHLQENFHPVPHEDLVDVFPVPPPDFFSHGVCLELPAEPKCQPEIICTSQTHDYRSASNVKYAAAILPNGEDHLVVDMNSPLKSLPVQTQGFEQHLGSSQSDFYPRYGTLKATRHNPNSACTSGAKCDFSPPPSCLGLTDEDRGQVELFYRSHKTKVFAARCQANLYFGSARRHSSILPSFEGWRTAAAAEAPDNWVFVKTGIPILVLDTGESRRQRRLHVILAERGSGFVLWRDTVDHLTTYSPSADAGFHTMHLSKDHTKLAGLYFADPVHAGDFFDHLTDLTSDPDDPLLNLSLGAKRRKKKKAASKEKRKRPPRIRREDISMPCCFNHVTKLDRAEGLNLLESKEQRLQDL